MLVIKIPNPSRKQLVQLCRYFSLQAAVLVSSKRIEFSDIFINWTFYEDTIVMIRKDSTDDKLV